MSTFRRRLMMQSQYAIYTIRSNGEGAKIYFDGKYTGVDITNGKGIVKIKKTEAKEIYTVTLVGGNIVLPSDSYVFNVQNSITFSSNYSSGSISVTSYKIQYSYEYTPRSITAGEVIAINYNILDYRKNVNYYVYSISGGFISASGNHITVQQNNYGYTRTGQVVYAQESSGYTRTCQVTQYG